MEYRYLQRPTGELLRSKQCCESGMIYSGGSSSDFCPGSGSDPNYFNMFENLRKCLIINLKNNNHQTAMTLKEHPLYFLNNWNKKTKFFDYLFLYFCLDPDPKQIIPDPDPWKSSGSNRIRIHNTGTKVYQQPDDILIWWEYKPGWWLGRNREVVWVGETAAPAAAAAGLAPLQQHVHVLHNENNLYNNFNWFSIASQKMLNVMSKFQI